MALNYTNTDFTLTLDTGIDVTSASVKKIIYKRPDGVSGEWAATSDNTAVKYNVSDNDITQAGTWQFQAYVEIGGEIGRGEIVSQTFQPHL